MNLTALGGASRTIFLQHEAHKLTVEFEASAAIKAGEMVKLVNDGRIAKWVKTDLQHLCIGIAVMDAAAAGDMVTVWTRGYCLITALSHAALNAGPALYESTVANGDNAGYTKWDDGADATNIAGWILDDAAAPDELIRVLIKN